MVSALFFFDSATGEVYHFKISNETKAIVAFQDIPQEEREKSGAVIALNCTGAAQLIVTFLLYARIIYKTYSSTLNVALDHSKTESQNKSGRGELVLF